MKNITYSVYLLFLFILSACSQGLENAASIEGEIKGMGNDTLYICAAEHYNNRVDTILVNEDKFKAVISVDTLTASWIQYSDGRQYPLYFDKGDKIRIKGDLAESEMLDVQGNLQNEELVRFFKDMEKSNANGQMTFADRQQQVETFIRSHNTSLASIYLLRKYFVLIPDPDFQKIQTLINTMSGTLKDDYIISELSSFIFDAEKTAIGKMAPYFRINDSEDEKLTRTDFKGKWILIHFWASWDVPSQQQLDFLRRIYKEEKKNKHFALLGVSLDVDRKQWMEAIEQDTLKWKQGSELAGWNSDIVKKFSVYRLPSNILLNAQGKIMDRDLDEADIRRWLKTIEEENEKKK